MDSLRAVRSDLGAMTVLVLLFAFMALASLQWLSARWLYGENFESAERVDALARARHVQAIVNDRTDFLRRNAADNGAWDEGYAFMLGKNPDHPRHEFGARSYSDLHIAGFAFIGMDGRVVDAEQHDPVQDRYVSAGDELRRALSRQGAIGSHLEREPDNGGFVRLGGMLYTWGAAPIIHSDGSGPAVGFLVMTSQLDEAFLRSASGTVNSEVGILTQPIPPGGIHPVHTPLDYADAQFLVKNGAVLEMHFCVGALDEKDALNLTVSIPRVVHAAAMRSSHTLLSSTVVFGVFLSGMALFFVQRRLLRPIQVASGELTRIGVSGDLAARLTPAPHADQIGELIDAANGMLARIQERDGQLVSAVARNAAILEAIPDLLFELDIDGRYIDYHSPRSGLLAAPPEVFLGKTVAEILPPAAAQVCMSALEEAERDGVAIGKQIELRISHSKYWFELSVSRKAAGPGQKPHFIVLSRDITERRNAEERIRRLAHFDVLTELPNRQSFLDRVDREIGRAQHDGGRLGVLFLDLDGFKNINDTLGHDSGDVCLKLMAERLREGLRTSDMVSRATIGIGEISLARLGGDEFTALLPGISDPENVWVVANRLLELMRQPFLLEDHEVQLTVSIGIALYPNDGNSAIELLKHADTAMYHAKERGRDNCQSYSASLTQKAVRRMNLVNNLRHALERREFHLLYQPQIDAKQGRIASVEALIRWQHPEEGLIAPLEFIPLAEQSGLIVPIGEWVLRTACTEAARWKRAGLRLRVAVNLSPLQFKDPRLLRVVREALAQSALPADLLELEITEGAVMQDDGQTLATLHALRGAGVRISLDDFGTGYSSMNYLKRMPLNNLKVDRSFVDGLPSNGEDHAIVRAIISMAKSLGFSVTAEGVETLEQAGVLTHMACDMLQGYYFSQPVAAVAIPALLTRKWPLNVPSLVLTQ
jgi:diguanylate cyclase (GGDEF)-like protein/PAS domain S-box-containing protein